jgi:hypothetical protein
MIPRRRYRDRAMFAPFIFCNNECYTNDEAFDCCGRKKTSPQAGMIHGAGRRRVAADQ